MNYVVTISNMIIPMVIFYIVAMGILNRQNVYEDFIEGAKGGFQTVVQIMPTLVGLMMGVGILRASGFLDMLVKIVEPITSFVHFPAELLPLTLVKLFSSSAATGVALDLFKQYGTDSYIGLCTSILLSCTETVFYTMSVYFLAAKVTKTRFTLPGALFSTIVGVIASVVIAGLLV